MWGGGEDVQPELAILILQNSPGVLGLASIWKTQLKQEVVSIICLKRDEKGSGKM